MSTGVSPTTAQVEAHIHKVARRHGGLVKISVAGPSESGQPLYAVTITDPVVKPRLKQHALIVAGEHGNEESGRMVALAAIDWLCSKAGAETRRKQTVVVMPNLNPDGADRDEHNTPQGNKPNNIPQDPAQRCAEAAALAKVIDELQPEAYLDLHSRGNSGCSHDMVIFPYCRPYTEDEYICYGLAAEMARAAEKSGIPQVTHSMSWPGWGHPHMDHVHAAWYPYRNYRSLVMLTENSEHNDFSYPERLRRISGLEKVKTMLQLGNRHHPKLPWEGYPFCLVSGQFRGGLVAAGRDAAERRRSRVMLWNHLDHIKARGLAGPEQRFEKTAVLKYEGPDLDVPVGLQVQVGGELELRSVTLQGKRLRKSLTDGYTLWHAAGSAFVLITLPRLTAGERRWELRFKPVD